VSQATTVTIDQAIALALDHHRAGRLADAEAIYRQVLAQHPNHADALNLLGALAYQVGRRDVARELIGRALALRPSFAEAHNNLAAVLQADGNLPEAETHFRQALALAPFYHEARLNLGILLWQSGKPAEAAEHYREILARTPEHAEAHNNLGNALYDLGEPAAAGESFCRALAIKPGYAAAHSNLGNVLCDLGEPAEALEHYEQVVAVEPGFADYHMNLGNALRDLGRLPEAIARYDQALALRPGLDDARWNQAIALLLAGDYERGWDAYRARWQTRALLARRRSFSQPAWDGADPAGRIVLVHAEQGMGDVIQFCRYVPLLKARGARIVLLIDREWAVLAPLLRGLDGVDQLALDLAEIETFDLHCPLLDLPLLFGTRLETIPATVPYLGVDPARRAVWRGWLDEHHPRDGTKRIGLVWAGNPSFARDRLRSPGLAPVLKLLELRGLSWFGLQVGAGRRALDSHAMPDNFTDLGRDLRDFADTAAVMEELDLVITSCTATAHLAGALGRPTWVMLPAAPDWRWLLERADSPWYPTMRLFRQAAAGDWSAVVARLADALDGFARAA
jgi:tetratricopeptide (TPR) repeat protein